MELTTLVNGTTVEQRNRVQPDFPVFGSRDFPVFGSRDFPVFGSLAVLAVRHLRCLAIPPFGISAVRHFRV